MSRSTSRCPAPSGTASCRSQAVRAPGTRRCPPLRSCHNRYTSRASSRGSWRISQPTLSQQIKQLERAVGAQLLDRTGRTVRLTDTGTAYAAHARRALGELSAAQRAVQDVGDLSQGHVRLGATPTFTAYLIGSLAAELHTRHPNISLRVIEDSQDRIEAALLADDLDLGIAFTGPHLPGISATALFTETLSLVVGSRPDHPATEALPVQALGAEHLALLSGDFATRGHIDAYFAVHDVAARIMVEANTIQALTEIVQRTPLATVLPDAITHDHPHLTPIALDPPLPARTVALLHRDGAYLSAATHAFTRLTHDLVQARGFTPPPV